METPPLSVDHTESLETMAPREERGSLKRKSDEDLGNDPKRRPGTVQEDSLVVEQDRKVIISMYTVYRFLYILNYLT